MWDRVGAPEYLVSLLATTGALVLSDAIWTPALAEWLAGANAPAWVQAIGSIVAIVATVAVTSRAVSRQIAHEADLQRAAQVADRQRLASALAIITTNAFSLLQSIHGKLNTRDAVHQVASGEGLPFDLPELDAIEAAISRIPLHELPHELVSPAMRAGWTIRQFRAKVQMALATHRDMDAAAFEDFLTTLPAMCLSLRQDVADILRVVPGDDAAI